MAEGARCAGRPARLSVPSAREIVREGHHRYNGVLRARSSSGLGCSPLKAEISGSNPLRATDAVQKQGAAQKVRASPRGRPDHRQAVRGVEPVHRAEGLARAAASEEDDIAKEEHRVAKEDRASQEGRAAEDESESQAQKRALIGATLARWMQQHGRGQTK